MDPDPSAFNTLVRTVSKCWPKTWESWMTWSREFQERDIEELSVSSREEGESTWLLLQDGHSMIPPRADNWGERCSKPFVRWGEHSRPKSEVLKLSLAVNDIYSSSLSLIIIPLFWCQCYSGLFHYSKHILQCRIWPKQFVWQNCCNALKIYFLYYAHCAHDIQERIQCNYPICHFCLNYLQFLVAYTNFLYLVWIWNHNLWYGCFMVFHVCIIIRHLIHIIFVMYENQF